MHQAILDLLRPPDGFVNVKFKVNAYGQEKQVLLPVIADYSCYICEGKRSLCEEPALLASRSCLKCLTPANDK